MMNKDPIKMRDEINFRIMNHYYKQGPILLLGGPGTGKTYSLLETIKTQLGKGLEHFDFFEATLTKAAANDFIADARKQISSEFEYSSTLHFRAKGILHQHAGLLNLNPNFTIIDEKCEKLILKDISYMLSNFSTNIYKKLKGYQEASAKCLSIESDFSRFYQKLQFFYAAIDWFDVIKFVCQLLDEHQEVRDKECNKFKFLLIDEYQDLNPAEQKFIELLLNGRTNLLAVGDDDQSIYGWRYADPKGTVNFNDRYPNAMKETLPVTSRLPSKVINASNSLISQNNIRIPKEKLIPLNETEKKANGGFVISVNLKSEKAEQKFIGKVICKLLNKQISPDQILVLCNCSALGTELISRIQDFGIQIPIYNDLEKDESINENKLLLECIRKFIYNKEDNLSLRIILEKLLEAHPNDCSFLVRHSLKEKISLWEAIKTKRITYQLKNSSNIIVEFVSVVQRAIQFENHKDRLNYVLSKIHPLSNLFELLEDERGASDNIGGIQKSNKAKNGVRFMTLHSSKGLDADFIFIPFMEESIGLSALDKEEKRRLLYVAITRAKVGVIFSWAWSRHTDKRFKCEGSGGGVIHRKPSSFIAECGISPNLCPSNASPSPSERAIRILLKYADCVRSFNS